MSSLDHRLYVFRDDLADARLKGRVNAKSYVTGKPARITAHFADLLSEPRNGAPLLRQAIRGELVSVFENDGEYAWVQRGWDGYVGYAKADAVGSVGAIPSHRVSVPRTFLYPDADLRSPRSGYLSIGSMVKVAGYTKTRGTQYGELDDGNFIITKHLDQVEKYEKDYVTVAGTLLNTPYLWGGNSGFGLDCAGLVQLSMMMTGKVVAADSDLQAASIGTVVDTTNGRFDDLQRGDLVFWKSHVGIMEDEFTLLHASGHTMTVAREPLREAIERIAYLYQMPTIVRRP